MMKRTKYILPVLMLCAGFFSFTERTVPSSWENAEKSEVAVVYAKALEWFTANTNCKVDVRYATYTDYISSKPYDQSEGFYRRDKNNIHSMAFGISTIQNSKICLIVDSANQLIVLKNKAGLNQSLFDEKGFFESLERVKACKKQKTADGAVVYRLDFGSTGMYSASEFKVNAKGLITEVKYYYNEEIREDEDDEKSLKGKPRLEISFMNYKTNVSFNYGDEFSEEKYIKEEGKKMVLRDNFKEYELKDYRFKNSN